MREQVYSILIPSSADDLFYGHVDGRELFKPIWSIICASPHCAIIVRNFFSLYSRPYRQSVVGRFSYLCVLFNGSASLTTEFGEKSA